MILLVVLAALPSLAESVSPPKAVQERLAPVLGAAADLDQHGETRATADALDSALSVLLADHSRAGDEALAILLGLYVGEHASEDVSCELVGRGKRVLKYLAKYATADVSLSRVSAPFPRAVRSEYPIVVERINSRETCAREP